MLGMFFLGLAWLIGLVSFLAAVGLKDGPGAVGIGIAIMIVSVLIGLELGRRWTKRQQRREKR